MTDPSFFTSLARATERAEERGDFVEARRLHAEAAAMYTADVRRRRALQRALEVELARLATLAHLATGDAHDAGEALTHLWKRALALPTTPDPLLGLLLHVLGDSLGREAGLTPEHLDDVLRAEESRTVDPAEPPIAGDLTRIPALIGEVRRYCLGSVLRTLSPSVRVAFVLVDVLGVAPVAAAAMLNTRDSALQVRLGRARRSLAEYLGPRCAHLGRRNPCTCAGRLGRALDAGFVTLPRRPVAEPPPGPFTSPAALYQALPLAVPDLPAMAPDDAESAREAVKLWQRAGNDEQAGSLAAEFGVALAGWFDLHRARCNRADHFGFFADRMARRGRLGWARALYARAAVHEEVLLGLAPPPDLLGVFARSAAACWRKGRSLARLTALVHRLEPLGLPPALWAEIVAMHAELTGVRRDPGPMSLPERLVHARRHQLHARRRRWAWRNLAWHRFASNTRPNPHEQQALAAHRHFHRQLRGARAEGPA